MSAQPSIAQAPTAPQPVAALEVEYAYHECEAITRREAANFFYGIRLLPRFKRQAMCAVYAFARRVDDIGDGDGYTDRDAQLAALAREREMLAQVAAGAPDPTVASSGATGAVPRGLSYPSSDPVMVALAHASFYYRLPHDALELLIEGVERDVRGSEYRTFDDLVRYCRCVAGGVGRLCLAIFSDGTAEPEAHRLADDLGVAMQITNILRDVLEDRGLGRVYLPAEDLERFGCTDIGLPGAQTDERRAVELITFEAQRADEWFARGLQLLDHLDSRSAACVQAMTGIYREILDRILADPAQVLRGRISLSTPEKTLVALRSLASAARR